MMPTPSFQHSIPLLIFLGLLLLDLLQALIDGIEPPHKILVINRMFMFDLDQWGEGHAPLQQGEAGRQQHRTE